MTSQQVATLKLGIAPIDEKTILIVESALEWLQNNTTLEFDINNEEDLKALPSCVRLFLIKYFDLQMLNRTVSSESIEGLNQSFRSENSSDMLWDIANELLGKYIKSQIRFVPAQKKWR